MLHAKGAGTAEALSVYVCPDPSFGMKTERLELPKITVCAVDTRHPDLALQALVRCMASIRFGRAVLFTASSWQPASGPPPDVEIVPLDDVNSAAAYSAFMLKGLLAHIHTDYVLVVQWDGFVVEAGNWSPAFLDYDYIGAVWPQFSDGRRVGNGGFSLRSRRLLEALQSPDFPVYHPEDVAICRLYAERLEQTQGMHIAPEHVADRFAVERQGVMAQAFGFHGFSNMVDALPQDVFRSVMNSLPPDVFLSTEARRAIRKMLERGWLDMAQETLARRAHHSSWSWGNIRLWCRVTLARWF